MSGQYRLNEHQKKTVKQYVEEKKKDDEVIRSLQAEAAEIFAKRGPLCDNEGFYQHYGECWSDALQHALNNADGIKERMQEFYITRFLDFDTQIPELQGLYEDLLEQTRLWCILYIREAQKRFLRHYITEASRRKVVEEQCEVNPTAKVAQNALLALSKQEKARKQGVEGASAAIFGGIERSFANQALKGARPTLEAYRENPDTEAGGFQIDITKLLMVYGALLFPERGKPYRHRLQLDIMTFTQSTLDPAEFEELLPQTTAILFSTDYPSGKGHQLTFYQCGGKEYLYEDNEGAYPFLWKTFLSEVVRFGEEERRYYKNPNIYFCPMKVFRHNPELGDELLYDIFCFPVFYYLSSGTDTILCLIETEFERVDLDDSFNPHAPYPLEFKRGDRIYALNLYISKSLQLYDKERPLRNSMRFLGPPPMSDNSIPPERLVLTNKNNPIDPSSVRLRNTSVIYKGGSRKAKKLKKNRRKSRVKQGRSHK